jgi:hypothetical protein
MFEIRQSQVEALARANLSHFESRADQYLCESFPDNFALLPLADRLEFIRQSRTRAARYGLNGEQAIVCYAHLCLMLGADFESQSKWDWIPNMLRDVEYEQNFRAKLALQCAAEIKMAGV